MGEERVRTRWVSYLFLPPSSDILAFFGQDVFLLPPHPDVNPQRFFFTPASLAQELYVQWQAAENILPVMGLVQYMDRATPVVLFFGWLGVG